MEKVAPFAGAWIEIQIFQQLRRRKTVAPFAGAWIEICDFVSVFPQTFVAPFAGAWIEMPSVSVDNEQNLSLRSPERGLK